MANSLRASTEGLAIIDKARQRLGWTKTSTARWWQNAHTSRATLRRFWQGERIQQDIFIAICQVVGVSNWQEIAAPNAFLDSTIPYLNWDEAPELENFYGRNQELEQLEEWIVKQRAKLVTIVGLGAIGKTALALALSDHLQQQFESVIWKSLQSSPSLFHLLDSLLNILEANGMQNIEEGIAQLIDYLRLHRCLLILDGWETILEPTDRKQEYNQFLQQLSRLRHQSCILITSREKLSATEIDAKTHCLKLEGLQKSEALMLLQAGGFTGKEPGLSSLIRLYRGNPLALKIVISLILSVFSGNITAFLSQNTLFVGDPLRSIIKQQFERLSSLERDIVYWLVIWQEPVTFCRLQTHLLVSTDPAALLAAIMALERQSLLEKWFSAQRVPHSSYNEPAFTLQPLVMKILKDELVEQAVQEISLVFQSNNIGHFKVLRTHWLLRPGSDILVGESLLLQLREQLSREYCANLQQILLQILFMLKGQQPLAIGYVACNITSLLDL